MKYFYTIAMLLMALMLATACNSPEKTIVVREPYPIDKTPVEPEPACNEPGEPVLSATLPEAFDTSLDPALIANLTYELIYVDRFEANGCDWEQVEFDLLDMRMHFESANKVHLGVVVDNMSASGPEYCELGWTFGTDSQGFIESRIELLPDCLGHYQDDGLNRMIGGSTYLNGNYHMWLEGMGQDVRLWIKYQDGTLERYTFDLID